MLRSTGYCMLLHLDERLKAEEPRGGARSEVGSAAEGRRRAWLVAQARLLSEMERMQARWPWP
jgi:hypothetical protein